MKIKSLKFLLVCIVILCAISVPVLYTPRGNRLSIIQIEQLQSDSQLRGIGRLILLYADNEGGPRPVTIRDIIGNDTNDFQDMFYVPHREGQQNPHDRPADPMYFDQLADYIMVSNAQSAVVAYEKPSLWSDESVAVCFTNLEIKRLRGVDLKRFLASPH